MKLLNGARTIAALPNGWAQGDARYNMEDGSYLPQTEPSVSIGHLSSVFGLIEVMTEVIDLIDDEEVRDKWTEFCRLYNASREEQEETTRSEEHTSELQSRGHLVCRLLLENRQKMK